MIGSRSADGWNENVFCVDEIMRSGCLKNEIIIFFKTSYARVVPRGSQRNHGLSQRSKTLKSEQRETSSRTGIDTFPGVVDYPVEPFSGVEIHMKMDKE